MAIDKNVQIVVSAKDNTSSGLSKLESSISGIATKLTGAIAVAGSAFGAFALKSAMDFEQTAVAFETMLGDAGQAQTLLSQLSKFAAETPFEFPEIANAGKQLLAFGTSAGEIQGQLTMLGDIASGLSVPLGQLTYVFGQVQVAGRLMGGDLMQFTNAGVPLIETLSKNLGVAQSEIKKMVEQGKIGFEDVKKALESLTAEGGKFYGMMAKQSKTMAGLWSTVSDALGELGRELFGISNTGEVRVGSMFDTLRTKIGEFLEKIEAIKIVILEWATDFGRSFSVMYGIIKDGAVWIYESITGIFSTLFEWLGISTKNNGFQWSQLFTYIAGGASVLAHYLTVTFAGIVGGFKMISVGIGTLIKGVINSIYVLVANGAGVIQEMVNVVIGGIRLIQGALGITQTEFATFGKTMMSEAISQFKDGFSEGSDAMLLTYQEMTSKMDDSSKTLNSRLNTLSANFETTFKTTAIPVLEDTTEKTNDLGDAIGGNGSKSVKNKVDELAKKMEDAANTIEQRFSQVLSKIDTQKNKVSGLKDEYGKLKEKLKEVGTEGAKELAKIDEQLDKQAKKIQGIYNEGAMDIGSRALEIQKEIAELDKQKLETQKEWNTLQEKVAGMDFNDKNKAEAEIIAKQQSIALDKQKLENELALAKATITTADMQKAKEESEKSEVQKIIEKTVAKLDEAELERAEILKTRTEKLASIEIEKQEVRKQMDEKEQLIRKEHRLYGSLIAERIALDSAYFDAFGKRIDEQMSKTQQAISLMQTLNASGGGGGSGGIAGARANGGPVNSGETYLVGERGPELFTPSKSGSIIPNGAGSITIGTINISGGGNARSIAQEIRKELTRELQLYKLGVS